MPQCSFLILLSIFLMACTPTPEGSEHYTEQHRPQFHFSPAEKWMNDPNGMVYYDGEYHLFYQHYPDSTVWGPMHWGHAVSEDLVHWEHLPIALYPEDLGYIFSGSAVIDWENTTGFQEGEHPPMVAIFTFHDPVGAREEQIDYQTQGIAYSLDRGRSWTMYEGNPVLPNPGIRDFRDPKVIWHQASEQWVMVLAAKDRAHFYGSPNLIDWAFLSEFGASEGNHGGVWECPDLFPMTVEETGEEKWVLIQSINPGAPNGGSGTQYFIGDFDGTTFVNDNPPDMELWIDSGRDNYAGVTWSDIPAEDGRRIFMGWMNNWAYAQVVPTEKWRSAMTLPRTLELVNTSEGLRVMSTPVEELKALRGPAMEMGSFEIDSLVWFDEPLDLFEAVLTFDLGPSASTRFGVELANERGERYHIGYDRDTQRFYSDRQRSGDLGFSERFAVTEHVSDPVALDETATFHLFVDAASIDFFAADGAVVFTDTFFPAEDFHQLTLFSEGGKTRLSDGTVYPLKSIWR